MLCSFLVTVQDADDVGARHHVHLPLEDPEKAVAQLNGAVDAFAGQPGLERVDVLLNRRSGAAMTITVWESEEAMRRSDDDADRLRGHLTLEALGWIDRVSEYELVRSIGT
jgi:heme-degrading monooxygenase HmoA